MARLYNYASAPDVVALLTNIPTLTATSRPNATQVHSHLTWASNELDAALLRSDYSVPVSATAATQASESLRGWAAVGAAMRSAGSMPQGEDSKHYEIYREQWSAILDGITTGDLPLPGIDVDAGVSLPRFPRPIDPESIGASPFFTRDQVAEREVRSP
jgi:hypothetical protein